MAGNGALQIFDLPKYADGKEITYTISEDTVDGYTPAYSDFNVTNRYTPEQTSVKVTKAWMDNNNQDGIRPESITVKLLANGQDTGKPLSSATATTGQVPLPAWTNIRMEKKFPILSRK